MHGRGAVDVEDLLKVVLVLVIVWLAINVLEEVLGLLLGPIFAVVQPLLGLIILALIVLWLLDKI